MLLRSCRLAPASFPITNVLVTIPFGTVTRPVVDMVSRSLGAFVPSHCWRCKNWVSAKILAYDPKARLGVADETVRFPELMGPPQDNAPARVKVPMLTPPDCDMESLFCSVVPSLTETAKDVAVAARLA